MNDYVLEFKEDGESWDVYLDDVFVFNSSLYFEGYKNRLLSEEFLNEIGEIENTHLEKTTYRSNKAIEEIRLSFRNRFKKE